MMLRYCAIFLALLLAATPVVAAESLVSGEISLGVNVLRGDDDESAKLQEYRDLSDGVISGLDLFAAKDGFYLTLDASQIGRDDQSYQFKTGRFGDYRLTFFYDELDHNYSFDARTFYAGAGTGTLTAAPGVIQTNPATWLPFDYVVERKNYGAKADLTLAAPFFLSFEATQTEKDGSMPWGVNHSTGGGSYFVELPAPVDYKTSTVSAKLGYSTKTVLASLDATLSNFENSTERLTWTRPTSGVASLTAANVIPHTFTTTNFLPPDNEMWQIGGQLVLRELPLNSTFALRGSHSQLESDDNLPAVTNSAGTLLTSARDFDGDVTYTTVSASLRSAPVDRLETDFTYHYVKKDNEAGSFAYGGPTTGATSSVNTHVFYYTKHNAAAEVAYRLPANNRIALGYDFTKIDRSEEMRHDAEETKDHLISVEWKNRTLDFLTAKVRYEHLQRNTDFNGASAVNAPVPPLFQDASIIYAYMRPFDAADKDQDAFKVAIDLSPCDFADLGLEYKYRSADYDDTVIGRTDDRSQELIVDASVQLPGKARLYGYAAYEKEESGGDYVYYTAAGDLPGGGRVTTIPIPSASENNDRYNWSVDRTDTTKAYGLKLEVPLFEERLKLTAAWDYEKNEGEAEFKSTLASIDTAMRDIDNYGDYTKKSISLKAEYAVTENLSMTAGYSYEKYNLDDIALNDYKNYYFNNAATSASYLTGAYADPDYDANIVYLSMAYKF